MAPFLIELVGELLVAFCKPLLAARWRLPDLSGFRRCLMEKARKVSRYSWIQGKSITGQLRTELMLRGVPPALIGAEDLVTFEGGRGVVGVLPRQQHEESGQQRLVVVDLGLVARPDTDDVTVRRRKLEMTWPRRYTRDLSVALGFAPRDSAYMTFWILFFLVAARVSRLSSGMVTESKRWVRLYVCPHLAVEELGRTKTEVEREERENTKLPSPTIISTPNVERRRLTCRGRKERGLLRDIHN